MEMASKDCVKVAVRVRPFNKVSTARLSKKKCRLVLEYVFRFICSTLFGSPLQQVDHEIEP